MRTLHQFHGGIHPPTHKTESTQQPIGAAFIPARLVIPFYQHAGNQAKPVVQVGDHVLKGQIIGMPQGHISSAIHASTSGTISALGQQTVAHPSGFKDLCATLTPDGFDAWITRTPLDYRTMQAGEMRHALRLAGVVGLGGAAFPSDIKLSGIKNGIHTLVLNGAECEPYITCDDMLMRERAAEILRGAEIMRALLNAATVLIGIEDNKPQAIAAMQLAVLNGAHKDMEVVIIPTIYPSGGEKQLLRVLTGIEVPAGARPTDSGVQCFNVATVYHAWRALALGEPLIARVVTVTGNVQQPQNIEVLLGTPVQELVARATALPDTDSYIMGGPMMGYTLPSAAVGVIKATNCIIASSRKLFPPPPPAMPCIRCTRCAEVCPADLQPQELYWFAQAKNFGKAQAYNLFDCIECGACSYVCPSHIPLVQYYRFAKGEIHTRSREKEAADAARERFEFRLSRVEREKQEKADKLAQRDNAVKQTKESAHSATEQKELS